MKYLTGEEKEQALMYLDQTAKVAEKATCQRAKCGSVIVWSEEVIGSGFNSPPGDSEKQRKCSCSKSSFHQKVTDKTCCVHAEQRAVMDALKKNPDKLPGSRLYFIRLGSDGQSVSAGEPYCTICSKMTLDAGVSEFVLWHEKGVCVYDTDEYNLLSYEYGQP